MGSNPEGFLNRSARIVTLGAGSLSAFLFLVGPLRHFNSLFGNGFSDSWMKIVLSLAVVAGAAHLFRARRVTKPLERSEWMPMPKALAYLPFVISLFIVIRAVYQAATTPYQWDELVVYHGIKSGELWQDGNLLSPRSHTLATQLTAATHALFGDFKFLLRFHSVLFTGLLVLLVNVVSRRFFTPLVGSFVLLGLAANEPFTWFAYQYRGYISLAFAGMQLLAAYWVASENRNGMAPKVMLFLAFLFPILTHGYGSIYSIVFFMAMVIWLYTNRKELDGARLQHGIGLVWTGLAAMPIILLVMLLHAKHVVGNERLVPGLEVEFSVFFGRFFSLGRSYWVRLLVLLLTCLACSVKKDGKLGFLSFQLLSLALVVAGLKLFSVPFPETRFLLPFLIPTLFWVAESIRRQESPFWCRVAGGAAILCLIVAPIRTHFEAAHLVPGLEQFQTFVARVKDRTAGTAPACFSCDGNPTGVTFSNNVFFPGCSGTGSKVTVCEVRYHLYAASGDPQHLDSRFPRSRMAEVFRDELGNILYRVK